MLSALREANMSRLHGDNISAAQRVEHPFRRTEVVGEGTAVAAIADTVGASSRKRQPLLEAFRNDNGWGALNGMVFHSWHVHPFS